MGDMYFLKSNKRSNEVNNSKDESTTGNYMGGTKDGSFPMSPRDYSFHVSKKPKI